MQALIAGHSQLFRKIFMRLLIDIGFNSMIEADSGKQVIDLFFQQPCDSILLSTRIHGLGIPQIVRVLRDNQCTVPIILIGYSARCPMMKRAMIHGATDFIVLPFEREELTTLVAKHLN